MVENNIESMGSTSPQLMIRYMTSCVKSCDIYIYIFLFSFFVTLALAFLKKCSPISHIFSFEKISGNFVNKVICSLKPNNPNFSLFFLQFFPPPCTTTAKTSEGKQKQWKKEKNLQFRSYLLSNAQ